MSKFQRRVVIPLLLTCFLSGCYKWSAWTTPATVAEPRERARITLDDGRVVELRSLEIRGDSVAGFAKEESKAHRSARLERYLADLCSRGRDVV